LEDIYEDSDESDNNDESDSDSDYTKAAEEPRITSEWETSVVYTESGAETDSSLWFLIVFFGFTFYVQ